MKITKEKTYEIADTIMEFLLAMGEMLPSPHESAYQHIKRLYRIEQGIPEPKKWRYDRAINRLREAGRIRITSEGDKLFIRLTKKGRIKALLNRMESIDHKKTWDGKWRLMIWDIPESARKQRNAIRRFAKKLGFYLLQKSVFIIPHELPKSAVDFLTESDLIKFIRFARIDKIDDDRELKKHFQLGPRT